MCCKKRFCTDAAACIFHNRPRYAHAVVGARAAADLIVDNQAFRCGIFKNIGDFRHFEHECRIAGGKVVRSPHTGKNTVHNADPRLRGGNEAARLCEYHAQRNGAHICRFARHVRAGYQHQAICVSVQQAIVRNEIPAVQKAFHNGVTAVLYGNDTASVDLRAGVALLARHCGVGAVNIKLRKVGRGYLYPLHLLQNKIAQRGKQLVFKRIKPVPRADDTAFGLFQLRCDKAFAVCKRLTADIFCGNLPQKGFGNLYVIAENAIVADFQCLYPGALALVFFYPRDPGFAVCHHVVKLVRGGVAAALDNSAFLQKRARLFGNGALYGIADIVQRVEAFVKPFQCVAFRAGKQFLYSGQQLYRSFERFQIACVRRPVNKPCDKPFDIRDIFKYVAYLLTADPVGKQLLHSIEPCVYRAFVNKRLFQHTPQKPCARGGFRAVNSP